MTHLQFHPNSSFNFDYKRILKVIDQAPIIIQTNVSHAEDQVVRYLAEYSLIIIKEDRVEDNYKGRDGHSSVNRYSESIRFAFDSLKKICHHVQVVCHDSQRAQQKTVQATYRSVERAIGQNKVAVLLTSLKQNMQLFLKQLLRWTNIRLVILSEYDPSYLIPLSILEGFLFIVGELNPIELRAPLLDSPSDTDFHVNEESGSQARYKSFKLQYSNYKLAIFDLEKLSKGSTVRSATQKDHESRWREAKLVVREFKQRFLFLMLDLTYEELRLLKTIVIDIFDQSSSNAKGLYLLDILQRCSEQMHVERERLACCLEKLSTKGLVKLSYSLMRLKSLTNIDDEPLLRNTYLYLSKSLDEADLKVHLRAYVEQVVDKMTIPGN